MRPIFFCLNYIVQFDGIFFAYANPFHKCDLHIDINLPETILFIIACLYQNKKMFS